MHNLVADDNIREQKAEYIGWNIFSNRNYISVSNVTSIQLEKYQISPALDFFSGSMYRFTHNR